MDPENRRHHRPPQLGADQVRLLERLCSACAVSGDEGEVRAIVLEAVKPYAGEIKVDAMGSVLVTCRGRGDGNPRVMVAAHMDEVGVMLVKNEGGGFFRFETVGIIDVRQLPGQPVWVGREHIPGVIGVRPVHLIPIDDRSRPIRQEQLTIDVGEAAHRVHPGDRAVFATRFTQVGPSLRAKALDDRLGVATLIELIRHAPENVDLLAAFTVQEEIGRRGAQAAGYAFNPDFALAVDATPANDLPAPDGSENRFYNTRLDAGAAVYLADGVMIHHPGLVRHLVGVAERHAVPFQYRQPGSGSTDASSIQIQRQGIPAVSVSGPIRYKHTAASLARLSDWQAVLSLVYHSLQEISFAILDT